MQSHGSSCTQAMMRRSKTFVRILVDGWENRGAKRHLPNVNRAGSHDFTIASRHSSRIPSSPRQYRPAMPRAKASRLPSQPAPNASGAQAAQPPATSNTQPPSSFPAVLVPRNMLRTELESRSPKSLTSLIFSLMDQFPSTVPFVAKQANTALVFGSSDMRLPDTIVVPAKVWFGKDEGEGDGDAGDEGETAGKGKAKGKGRGKVKADRDKEKEMWTKDPTLDEDEVVGGSDKENAEGKPATQAKGKGKEPAAPLKGKEPVANARGKEQTKGKEHATQPDASRKRAASRVPSPTPKPQSKRRKADENVRMDSSSVYLILTYLHSPLRPPKPAAPRRPPPPSLLRASSPSPAPTSPRRGPTPAPIPSPCASPRPPPGPTSGAPSSSASSMASSAPPPRRPLFPPKPSSSSGARAPRGT